LIGSDRQNAGTTFDVADTPLLLLEVRSSKSTTRRFSVAVSGVVVQRLLPRFVSVRPDQLPAVVPGPGGRRPDPDRRQEPLFMTFCAAGRAPCEFASSIRLRAGQTMTSGPSIASLLVNDGISLRPGPDMRQPAVRETTLNPSMAGGQPLPG
jgi:hypothetical protein